MLFKAVRERLYRHSTTQRTARLHVRPLHAASSSRRWELRLVCAEGSVETVAGQTAVVWLSSPTQLRAAYRDRLRALRSGGWRPVA
jgi:acyl-CoA thioesterase FadM